jgi:hypothetical protein
MAESARRRAREFHADRMVENYGAFFERLAGSGR